MSVCETYFFTSRSHFPVFLTHLFLSSESGHRFQTKNKMRIENYRIFYDLHVIIVVVPKYSGGARDVCSRGTVFQRNMLNAIRRKNGPILPQASGSWHTPVPSKRSLCYIRIESFGARCFPPPLCQALGPCQDAGPC